METDTWAKLLDGDIATLLLYEVKPPALVRRLEEALAGENGHGTRREFSSCGGGWSNQYPDQRGRKALRVVVLEFWHRKPAKEVLKLLRELKPRFRVITRIRYDEFGQDNARITLELPERPK